MASRRRSRNRTLTGSISDVQRRIKYLESRPSPSRLGNFAVDENNLAPRVVTTDKIMVQTITRELVADSAIGDGQLDIDSVGSAEIKTDAVGSAEIVGDSVGTSELSVDAVYRENILTDAVGNDEIASDAVGSSEISQDSVGFSELNIDAAGAENLQTDSVGNSEIASDAVNSSEITADAVGSSEISADAVGASELGLDAVGNSELAANAVGTENVISGSITDGLIDGTSGVSASKIRGDLTNATIGGSKVNGDLTNATIAVGKVTGDLPATRVSGVLSTSNIPLLPTSIINSGEFSTARIPNLDAGKINSGIFADARIPQVSASKIDSGTLAFARLPVGSGSNQVAIGNHTHTGGTVPGHTHSASLTMNSLLISGGAHGHVGQTGSHNHGITPTGFITVGAVNPSTIKVKQDISDFTIQDPKNILNLKLKRYKYKNSVRAVQNRYNREWMYGYIAEEVQDLGIEPILAYDKNGDPDGIDYGLISTLVLELVKVQQIEIDSLKEEIQRLKEVI